MTAWMCDCGLYQLQKNNNVISGSRERGKTITGYRHKKQGSSDTQVKYICK